MVIQFGLSIPEVGLRIGAAMLCGAVIGLNRDLHHKPAGLRTFTVVALASAAISLVVQNMTGGDPGDVSRVVQGIVTGIGFLGAGLIVHRKMGKRVSGLTTAAAVWLASVLGITCGLGLLAVAGVVLAGTLLILLIGRPIERWLEQRFPRRGQAADDAPHAPHAPHKPQAPPPPDER